MKMKNLISQLYYLELRDDKLPTCIDDLYSLITQEKRERILKFRFDIDKKLSLYSDLLVRILACKILNLYNHNLEFSENDFGKPYLIGYPNFKYNISHTQDAIAIGISFKEIGIDIEKIKHAEIDIAKRFFVSDEKNYVFYEDKDRNRRFYEVWTKKESYIKWVGKGLNIPLNSFNIFNINLFRFYSYDDYAISICCEDTENAFNEIRIEENQLILDALKLKTEMLYCINKANGK